MPLDSDQPVSLTRAQIARLEAEARAVLASVEPRHAEYERHMDWTRDEPIVHVPRAVDGELVWVVMRKSDWRPRATRTPSGWAIEGGWLDEPVPPLPTGGVPNAGGVACIVARTEDVEARTSILARTNNVYWSNGFAATAPIPTAMRFMQMHDSAWEKAGRPQGEAAKSWYRSRAEARDYPAERGWCSGLGASEEQAKRGTAAGWRLLCGVLRSVLRETDAAWTAERAEIVRAKGEG